MKRKLFILALLTSIILLAVFYFFYTSDVVLSEREQQIASIKEKDKRVNAKKQELFTKVKVLENEKGRALTIKEQIALLPARMQKSYAFIATLDRGEVSFFGKVVDQYDNPVSGVRIKYFNSPSTFNTGITGFVTSDQNGNFHIEADGTAISVQDFSHPAIEFRNPNDPKGESIGFDFGYATYHTFKWRDHKTQDTAFVFKAWRIQEFEEVEQGSPYTPVESGGDWRTFDFLKDRRRDTISDGITPGHIRVRGFVEPYPEDMIYVDAKVNWWLELEAVDGGLIEVPNDPYLNLAPETGYQQTIRVEAFANGREGPQRINNKRYYFKSNNGEEYGSLVVTFVGVSSNKIRKPGVGVSYKINPNGSRNLAVKPKN